MNLSRCDQDDSISCRAPCFRRCFSHRGVASNDRVRMDDDSCHDSNRNLNLEEALSSLLEGQDSTDDESDKGMSNKLTVTFAEKTRVYTVESNEEDRECKWYKRDEWRAMRREAEETMQAAGHGRNNRVNGVSDLAQLQQLRQQLQQIQQLRLLQQHQQHFAQTANNNSAVVMDESRHHCTRSSLLFRSDSGAGTAALRRRRCRKRRANSSTVILSVLVEQVRLGANQQSIATTSSALSRRDVKNALRRAAVDAAEVKQDLIEYAMRRIQQGVLSPRI